MYTLFNVTEIEIVNISIKKYCTQIYKFNLNKVIAKHVVQYTFSGLLTEHKYLTKKLH